MKTASTAASPASVNVMLVAAWPSRTATSRTWSPEVNFTVPRASSGRVTDTGVRVLASAVAGAVMDISVGTRCGVT